MPLLSPTGSRGSSSSGESRPAPACPIDARDVLWRRSPDSIDFDRHYPRRALNEGVQGRAVVEGVVRSDGRLIACRIIDEAPPDYGFGQATLVVAGKLQVRLVLSTGESLVGATLRVPLTWRVC